MKKFLILILVCHLTNLINGQSSANKYKKLSYDFGIGIFANNNGFGPSLMPMNLKYNLNNDLISLKSVLHYDVSESGLYKNTTPAYFWDIGLLYGKKNSDLKEEFSFSGGIGIMGGGMNGKYMANGIWTYDEKSMQIKRFVTINIPLEVQYNYTVSHYYGIGVNVFLNLNIKKVIGGFLFTIR